MLGNDIVGQGQNVLAFVVVDQVDLLQRGNHVVFLDRSLIANFVDRDRRWVLGRLLDLARNADLVLFDDLQQHGQNGVGPVTTVAQQTQIGERLLGAAGLSFEFAQLVAELDEELAVAHPLVLWEGQDTGDVVVFRGLFLFAEVAHDVVATVVGLTHDIEEEGVRVVVKRFMVEKQLGQKAKILSVLFVLSAVDFEEGNSVLLVDFVPRRMLEQAFR